MTSAIDDSAVLRAMKLLSCEQFNLLFTRTRVQQIDLLLFEWLQRSAG